MERHVIAVVLLLFVFSSLADAGSVGVNYGRIADNLPSAYKVVQLLKSQGLERVKVFDSDPAVLRALSGSDIKVTVDLPNELLSAAARSQSYATNWVQRNVVAYHPNTHIEAISVGNEPPVRKQCVSLLTLLSNSHGDALAPFLSKMISTDVRRLCDLDSVVRSACVEAVSTMSSKITTPAFSSSFLKPLMDALATEQDLNSQIGSALCLAGAIDSAPDPDPVQLKRSLQRLGKLAKSESFKAKAALLVLVGSIVGAGGASSQGTLDWLVPCGVEFLSSEDWTVRKAAAEALGKVATMETDLAPFYKASCLKALESRRFDKVKVVRETMNQALELWKVLLAGDSEEIPAPIKSRSSTDNGIGRGSPPSLKSSDDPGFRTPQPKKTVPTNRSPPSDASLVTTAKKGNPLSRSDRNPDTAVLHPQDLAASALPPWLLPLNNDTLFIWDDACRNAFESIKKYLASSSVLGDSMPAKPLILYIAAQKGSIEALLAQENEDQKEIALYYLSRTLTGVELNYSSLEKICLVLVFAVQKLRHYMHGYTIHLVSKADLVKYVMSKPVLTGRLVK
ncbi:TORTIFOLIA1-like protein 4 [Pyrus x bretschneideri]|uniref:TORTIFOLIA1-like protein 4 n=1 Tax=Pyrus x bretschneideri TaxID=225117 RepID=UPI00202FCC54|nr:TORTIFOLIA1-like protein 4 [Pyrus x bretschneideri]